jgi:superfamily I DNA/RNA helicase
LEAIARGDVKPKGPGRTHLVARAAQVYEYLQNCSKDHAEAIGSLFDPSLASKISDEGKRRKATRDLEHLRDSALLLARESKEGTDLKSILEKLRYRIATRIPLTEAESARVRIMTLHGAKGLEADVVIVAGTADEIIPGYLSEEPGEAEKEREERRRLLYVSVTRAKRQLVISWPLMMPYKDAVENQVRTDGGVITKKNGDKFVKLGKTQLLPDISQTPETGKIWLKSALSKS